MGPLAALTGVKIAHCDDLLGNKPTWDAGCSDWVAVDDYGVAHGVPLGSSSVFGLGGAGERQRIYPQPMVKSAAAVLAVFSTGTADVIGRLNGFDPSLGVLTFQAFDCLGQLPSVDVQITAPATGKRFYWQGFAIPDFVSQYGGVGDFINVSVQQLEITAAFAGKTGVPTHGFRRSGLADDRVSDAHGPPRSRQALMLRPSGRTCVREKRLARARIRAGGARAVGDYHGRIAGENRSAEGVRARRIAIQGALAEVVGTARRVRILEAHRILPFGEVAELDGRGGAQRRSSEVEARSGCFASPSKRSCRRASVERTKRLRAVVSRARWRRLPETRSWG